MQYGVIMAGGAGTRLWPLSRGNRPKQLLNVVYGKSLLRLSYDRLRGMLPAQQIFVCTGAAHGPQVLENLPELPPENLLGEPTARDTANAVGFPAAVLLERDKDATVAVVTADHVIEPVDVFQASLRKGFDVVAQYPKMLVTFGIKPTHGHPGLGYVHRGESLALRDHGGGVFRVQPKGFIEKPEKPTADRLAESGRYYWNSGMFVWRCDTIMGELQALLPDSYKGLTEIASAWNSPRREEVLNRVYPSLPKISIDYAVMEPASEGKGKAQVAIVEMPVNWLDVGSWPALAETLPRDEHNNATYGAPCVFLDADDNIVVSDDPNHLMTAIGVSDMIIVHTKDATLVCPKSAAQSVKDLTTKVKDKVGSRYQ
jgi:mannose-1-phosphate guanylyltransferase